MVGGEKELARILVLTILQVQLWVVAVLSLIGFTDA
jgi:hypothetical protein